MKKLWLIAVWCTVSAALAGCGNMVDGTKTTTLGTIASGNTPSMKADADGIYFCYHDDDSLMFMKSSDKGRNWTKTTLEIGNDAGYYSSLALSGSNIYVSYTVENGENDNLKFIKSADGGSTWSPAVLVDSTGDVGEYNSIAVYGNTVIISYSDLTKDPGNVDADLKAAVSTDGGSIWASAIVDGTNYVGMFTSIAVDGSGNFFISYWYGSGSSDYSSNPRLKVVKYNNSWSLPATIADSSLCYGLNTVIRASCNTVDIAYFDAFTYTNGIDGWNFTSDTFSIKVVKSLDSGGTWSTPVSVAYLTNIASYAYMNNRIDIVFAGPNVGVSYADVNMGAMYLAGSRDSGVSWITPPLVLDPALKTEYITTPIYYTSQLAIVGTELYSVYVDGLNSIVFALSGDSGTTWNWY